MKKMTNSLMLTINFFFMGFTPIKTNANLCLGLYGSKLDPIKVINRDIFKQRILSTGKQGQILLGFEANDEGKLMPIWADTKEFHSIRHVQTSGFFGATGWNPLREALLVHVRHINHNILGLRKDRSQAFPEEIKRHLDSGNILETDKPEGPLTYERFIEIINSEKEEWHVLMMAASPNAAEGMTKMEGRTGIILRKGVPFVASFNNGEEVILEQKGVGLPEGGFQNPIRSTHGNISGGASYTSAIQEFDVGQKVKDLTRVRIPLALHYKGTFGDQGVVFRWSPGTRRSSFSYPREKKAGSVSYLEAHARELSALLGKTVVQVISRGYLPRLHMENFVVSANSKKVDLTDFADIHPLSGLVTSVDFIQNLISHLYFLIERNDVNLGINFDKKAFISSIVSESDGLKLPQSPLKEVSQLHQLPPEYIKNALGDKQNEIILYAIFRAVAVGLTRSLGKNFIDIKHNLNVEEFSKQLNSSFSKYRSDFKQLESSFSLIKSLSPREMDNFERQILQSYEEAIVAKRMEWSLDGAESFFKSQEYLKNYKEYLKSFSVSYVSTANGINLRIPGGIDRIPEFKIVIEAQRKLIISYDLLWRSYKETGQEKMASYYQHKLEELFNLSPLEFLEKYK